jgi:hypothetical protein
MPTRVVRRSLAVVAAAALLAVGVQTQAPPPAPSLPVAVGHFLDEWLVRGNPRAAVAAHLSLRLNDERLIPAEYYSPGEYAKLMASPDRPAINRTAATERFERVMSRWSASRPQIASARSGALAPVDRGAQPELWEGLREFDITPALLSEVPALAYRLKDFSSYEWVSPVTVGYRTLVPEMISKGLHVEGVISRIRVRDTSKAWMLFMFWANEGTNAREDWKLLGLAPVPTE